MRLRPPALPLLALGLALACGPAAEPGLAVVKHPLVSGDLVINEVHPNPDVTSVTTGDTNGDGFANENQDEFVEIVNASGAPVSLDGVSISDSVSTRIGFGAVTVPAGEAVVVFGGGNPLSFTREFGNAAALGLVFVASGGLGLNNTGGDYVSLKQGTTELDRLTYSTTTDGVSFNRNPEGDSASPVVLHAGASLPGAKGGFSPGTKADGEPFTRTILSVAPNGGPSKGGMTVSITGAGFATGLTAVNFKRGGTSAAAPSFTRKSSVEITAVTPQFSAGLTDVEIVDSKGSLVGYGKFTFGVAGPDAGPDASELPLIDAGDFVDDAGVVEEPPPEPDLPGPDAGRRNVPTGPPNGVCGCASVDGAALPVVGLVLVWLRRRRRQGLTAPARCESASRSSR